MTFNPERNLDRDLVSRLSSMRLVAEGASVLVTGPTGAGKSGSAPRREAGACTRARRSRAARSRLSELDLRRASGVR
ncbi:MAG: hypothetical protein ACOC37_04705 [Spirochaetota bacterium]